MNSGLTYKVLVLNGPNLGYIGKRDINTYGSKRIEEIPDILNKSYPAVLHKTELEFFQSNGQGRIIDRLEKAWQDKISGIVINPGAYTHTSLALSDCLSWINIPYIEVHLSNIWSREQIRQHSFTAEHSLGVVAGFGIMSYVYGLIALVDHLDIQ